MATSSGTTQSSRTNLSHEAPAEWTYFTYSGGINAMGEATSGTIEEIDLAGNIIFELNSLI